MKILLIHNFYTNTGGEDLRVIKTAEILRSSGHTVIECYRKSATTIGFSDMFRAFFGLFFSYQSFIEVKKIIQKENPDVSVVFNVFPLLSPSVYIALKLYKIPTVQMVANLRIAYSMKDIFHIAGKVAGGKNVWKTCLDRGYCSVNDVIYGYVVILYKSLGVLSFFSYYVTPSEFMRQRLIESGVTRFRVEVIANPLLSSRGQVQLKKRKKYDIVFLGRLSYEKGVDILLSSLHHDFNGKIVIIGDGPEKKKLEGIVKKNKLPVTFLGKKTHSETLSYLRSSDICIVPSRWPEPFGNSILDAMSSGASVIASRIGGIPEIIQAKKTGLLFNSDDSDDLRVKINWIISHPLEKEKIIIEAYHSLQKYSAGEYVMRLESVLNKAILHHGA